jgi:hypothetical protein
MSSWGRSGYRRPLRPHAAGSRVQTRPWTLESRALQALPAESPEAAGELSTGWTNGCGNVEK